MILVSHSMPTVEAMCDQTAWLDRGVLKAAGPAKSTIRAYLESLNVEPD